MKKITDSPTRLIHKIKLFRCIANGYSDLKESFNDWRIWHLIGTSELRRRYARSVLGQFWLTLSSGISIMIMAFVWSALFKTRLIDMLPYMAVSITLWQFINSIITESINIFKSNSHMLLSQRMNCSLIVYACIYRNLLTLMHNILIVPVVFIIFAVPVTWQIFYLIPGLVLVIITSVWVSYLIAAFCARFRDLSNVISSVMQLAFYVTPVVWKPNFIGDDMKWIIDINPLAYYLKLLRSPIIGEPLLAEDWLIPLLITFIGLFLALIFIGKYRRQINYWV